MRLLEAIIQANHRAVAGDSRAGLRPQEYADSLPLVALTCIDPRLNPLMPEVLALPEEQFVWLRNAGNILTGPMSSTMRSLALACAIKGGKEIAIIGHTDCRVGKVSMLTLTEELQALGIDRARLPDNLTEYFGLFASERSNVIKAAGLVRQSPLIGPKVPVHGLIVNIQSGQLEWVVNGYQTLETVAGVFTQTLSQPEQLPAFDPGEMKIPEGQIGDAASVDPSAWLSQAQIPQPQPEAPPRLRPEHRESGHPPRIRVRPKGREQ